MFTGSISFLASFPFLISKIQQNVLKQGEQIYSLPSRTSQAFHSNSEHIMSETGSIGADVVILAIGVPAIVNSTISLARKGGSVCLFAGFAGDGMSQVSANTIHYNELKVCGSTAYTRKDYLDSAEIVMSGRINLDEIATHVYKLEQFQEAYEKNKEGTGLKIILEP